MRGQLTPLEAEIRRRIQIGGPMSVAHYMSLCLTHPEHGYYVTRDPLGAGGDFITAPEISQMFGELIGLWAYSVWRQMGAPEKVRLVELGPGRGTMMSDALRAVQVVPGFPAAIMVHLVEISPALEARQRQTLADIGMPVAWYRTLEEVPDGPTIILANEFFDALPVQQAVMCADGWHERIVKIGQDNTLQFSNARDPIPLFDEMLPSAVSDAKIGEIFEWRSDQIALELGRRVVRANGAALVIDYGHAESGTGETLQAVGAHDFVDPLTTPGQVDLTAHVDFQALGQAAESMRARVHGPIEQGEFLHRLGIASRAERLKENASPSQAAAIDAALDRLTSRERTGMGRLFKAMGFAHPKLGPLPCF
jgi:NADH dehydrogenase [ubiquinone] 1 alpha subcomplex assembly factor 7